MTRLLVIKPSSLGDILHGLQVVESLRVQVPGVEVHWVARDTFAPWLETCGTVDKVLVFERKGGVRAFMRLLRSIRVHSYDQVWDFQGLARSGLMTLAARSPSKAGRSDAREGAGLAYHHKVALPSGGKQSHAVDILLGFLPRFGAKPEVKGNLRFQSRFPASCPSEVEALQPLVFFPSSARPEKEWPHFEAFTDLCLQAFPARPIVWAGDKAIPADRLAQYPYFYNLTGRTRLEELPALVGAARLVVANDSGPMHLAAAMGTGLIALFGPTDPKLYGPYPLTSPRHHVIQAEGGNLASLSPQSLLQYVHRVLEPQ